MIVHAIPDGYLLYFVKFSSIVILWFQDKAHNQNVFHDWIVV